MIRDTGRATRAHARIAATIGSSGLYSIPVAARLLQESSSTVERWAFGYTRRDIDYPAAIDAEIPPIGDSKALSFLELVELMFIQALLSSGLSWSKVREASRVAARLLHGEKHPFATKRWFADPAAIYLQLGQEHGEDILVEVAGHAQVSIEPVLHPYLKQLDFDVNGIAQRFFPMGTNSHVVLDPKREFGMPITVNAGVATEMLAGLHRAGDSIATIASWYGMDEAEVEAAVRYEEAVALTA